MTPAAGLRILIVDDNAANLLALEALLADLGAEVVSARSGPDALAHLATGEFALVLLDAQMPGMDGFATAEYIRAQTSTRTPIPILMFVSAVHLDPTYIARGYAAGAVDYLVKPLDPDVLRTKIQIFLDLLQQTATIRRLNTELQAANAALEADIQLRRQVEAELRMSEAALRDLNRTLEARVKRSCG
jgi:CheY-like chemotaxis protein